LQHNQIRTVAKQSSFGFSSIHQQQQKNRRALPAFASPPGMMKPLIA